MAQIFLWFILFKLTERFAANESGGFCPPVY
jgi:hypothetical protein